jgi:hypothetical protein
LSEHFRDVGVTPERGAPQAWDASANPFGYAMPVFGPVRCSIELNPELIGSTTAWLNEFDLDEYLGTIEVMLDYRVAHHTLSDEAFATWFADFITNEAPGSLRLMQAVQERSDE